MSPARSCPDPSSVITILNQPGENQPHALPPRDPDRRKIFPDLNCCLSCGLWALAFKKASGQNQNKQPTIEHSSHGQAAGVRHLAPRLHSQPTINTQPQWLRGAPGSGQSIPTPSARLWKADDHLFSGLSVILSPLSPLFDFAWSKRRQSYKSMSVHLDLGARLAGLEAGWSGDRMDALGFPGLARP